MTSDTEVLKPGELSEPGGGGGEPELTEPEALARRDAEVLGMSHDELRHATADTRQDFLRARRREGGYPVLPHRTAAELAEVMSATSADAALSLAALNATRFEAWLAAHPVPVQE